MICTIVLPRGEYSNQRLPIWIAGLPDIFQEKISLLMTGLEFTSVYIDDLLCILTCTIDDHLAKLRQVLIRLSDAKVKGECA